MQTGHIARYVSAGVFLLSFAFLGACDPCAGITSCGSEPSIRYQGTIQLKFSGKPAANVRVEFVRTGGVAIDRDTLVAQTDSAGQFQLEAQPKGSGEVQGLLLIHSPGLSDPIRVPTTLITSPSDADARYLGVIPVAHLYFGYRAEFFYRGGPLYATNGVFARDVEVEFRRTGGIQVEPQTYTGETNGAAHFPLDPQPLEEGEVIFDLIVRPSAPYQSFTVSGLRMATRFSESEPNEPPIVRAGLGPHLPYVGALYYAETRQPAVGAEVEFRRTGGIQLAQETYLTTVNQSGNFHLGPVPLESGTVIADLVVRPPAPYRSFTIRDVRLQTTEEDLHLVPAGRWEVPTE